MRPFFNRMSGDARRRQFRKDAIGERDRLCALLGNRTRLPCDAAQRMPYGAEVAMNATLLIDEVPSSVASMP